MDDGALSKENILAARERMRAGVEGEAAEPWVCPQCEKRFGVKSEWAKHLATPHVPGKQFQCRRVACFDWFATRNERERHEWQEHGDKLAREWTVATLNAPGYALPLDANGNFRHPTRVEVWQQFVTTFPNASVMEWLGAVDCILAPAWK